MGKEGSRKIVAACALILGSAACIAMTQVMAAQPLGSCGFDPKTLSFRGTELQQAKCLLRPTKPAGHLDPELKTLPEPFEKGIGTPLSLDKDKFRAYLAGLGIAPNALGGSLDAPLSRSVAGSKPQARYFVIHDVSWNLCEKTEKLATSADPDADWNLISTWADKKQAHLYITRDGKLIAPQGRTFSVPWYATKLEGKIPDLARGLFLHIENVQLRTADVKKGENPRRKATEKEKMKGDLEDKCINDRNAENPGFTQVQYSRLALVYIAASQRAGKWLVPAYHVAMDYGLDDGHDDPQHFDINDFGSNICTHLTALGLNECTPKMADQ
jgi:hypothetical protein